METTIEAGEDGWLEGCFDPSSIGEKPEHQSVIPTTDLNEDEHKENTCKTHIASRPHSTPLTLKWLQENYELAEGVCIPRSTLYIHYLDYCNKSNCQPVNAASFGKIIRQQFPHLTTRRLGTRGQSKYHYYGIGVRENSLYYELMYSKKGVNNNPPDSRKEPVKQMITYSPRSKLGTLLPEFPNVKDFKLPPNITMDKVTTFLMMYRTHCQRILDTVIRANFDEVQSFLLHFWQGMPQHIVPVLGTTFIVNLVGVCDSILYKAITGVLMPTVLQSLPDSLTQVIRKFARQLDEWLVIALEGLPDTLRNMKSDLCRRFGQVLKRQTSLNHLCQASRTVIHNVDITSQMVEDWRHIDLTSICKQTLYTMDSYCERDHQVIVYLYKEFERLLQDQAPLEAYLEWLDVMVNTCVIQVAARKPSSIRRISRQFLLMWSCFGTRVIRDMTLHSAPSFGSFHLLHLMFDDYVLYLVETLHTQERVNDLLRYIRGQEPLADPKDEMVLPRPHVSGPFIGYSQSPESPVSMETGHVTMDRQTVIMDTREAYPHHYGSSPTGHPANQSRASPSHAGMTSPYGSRGESELQVSPTGDARMCSINNSIESRYNNVATTMPSSDNTSYQYTSVGNSQYSRDYSRTGEWTEKYGHGTQGYQQSGVQYPANYSTYNRDFDSTYYPGYDATNYPSAMRTHPQSNAYYGHYGNSETRAAYDSNANTNNANLGSRKRKGEALDERSYIAKRNNNVETPSDFEYGLQPSNYIRAGV